MMLAHAASAQGISAVENICGRAHAVDHQAVPAACFTHPEIGMVGMTEEQAKEKAKEEGWELGKVRRSEEEHIDDFMRDGIRKPLFFIHPSY